MLKARGIGVIFEKENINTLTESSEFLITLFSGFAQAESESLSSNIQLGIRMAMKEGKVNFHYRSMLGYQRGADGKPEIVPEEAEVVRRIFRRYLEGCSEGQIQRELTQDGIATAKGVKAWSHQIVHNILTNEKYAGDALLQKTLPQTASAKRSRRIPASCRSITSRTTTLLLSRGTSTSGYRRRWHGGPASERFCRKAEKQNRANIPPSMRSVSGWSVVSVVPPISGVPGPGTASNGSSGGASPG